MVDPSAEVGDRRYWLGGSNTDEDGFAAFNVEETFKTDGSTFFVDVNAPWDQRTEYSGRQYSALLGQPIEWADLESGDFRLTSPNLKVTVRQADDSNSAARWSWIGVEEVDKFNNYAPLAWVIGSGTDNSGSASVSLAAGKTYRISANPGPTSVGGRTTCVVATSNDATPVVSVVAGECASGTLADGTPKVLTMTLSSGNVIGTVLDASNNPIAGAVVFAEPGAGNNLDAVSTVTKANGSFGLQLDEGLAWTIKVIVPKVPGRTNYAPNRSAATLSGGWLVSFDDGDGDSSLRTLSPIQLTVAG
jgi:hypothetical protein